MTEQEPELGGNETLPVAKGAHKGLSYRGIEAWCEMRDDPDVPSHVIVELWYQPRRDGHDVPAYTAHVRAAGREPVAPLQFNPEPLRVVDRHDNVTAVDSIRGRSHEERLRVWLALGGTEDNFPNPHQAAS